MTSPNTSNLPRAPVKPFYFNTSAHLVRITQQKSNRLTEFLDALRECPEGSIFQHTFRTLEEHHFIREAFSNDFAHWALSACNEPGLAEALASVDVREFTSVAELRERFIHLTAAHPTGRSAVTSVPWPFEWTRNTPPSCRNLSRIPWIPTPEEASELPRSRAGVRVGKTCTIAIRH